MINASYEEKLESFARDLARSPLLDVDPEKKSHEHSRRDYLREIKALTCD